MVSLTKYLAKFIAHLVFAIIAATVLMIVVYALSTAPMYEHAKEFPELIKGEKTMWFETDMSHYSPHSVLDIHTDSLMILNAVYPISNSVIQAAMLNPRWLGRDESPINTLIDAIETNSETTTKNIDRTSASWGRINGEIDWDNDIILYPRYWHGYLTILKPALLVANVPEILAINSYLQFILMIVAILLFHQKLGVHYAAAFALLLLMMNPITMAQSFQFYAVFYIMLISVILIMWQNPKMVDKNLYPFFFLWIGIFTAFFDFLTAPIVTLGIPLIVYLILNHKDPCARGGGNIIFLSCSWLLGYFGMWAGKWLMGSILTDQNLFIEALKQAQFRSNNTIHLLDGTMYEISSLKVIEQNIATCFHDPIVLIFLSVFFGGFYFIKKHKVKILSSLLMPMTFIAILPFIWYIFVSQHSITHCYMTYRNLTITIFAILNLYVTSYEEKNK